MGPAAARRRDFCAGQLSRPGGDRRGNRADSDGPRLAPGGLRLAHRESPAPAGEGGDKHARPGAADRGALLEVRTTGCSRPGPRTGSARTPRSAPPKVGGIFQVLDFQVPKITAEHIEDNKGSFTVEPLDRGFGYTF